MADMLGPALHETHNTIVIEKNSHFQHLFAYPRIGVVPGFEHKAFVPYTNAFHASPAGSTSMVRATAEEILPNEVVLDNETSIPYEYLVFVAGTGRPGAPIAYEKSTETKRIQMIQAKIASASNIVVVGGGAYGVQVAFDIKEQYPSKKVTLIHSRPQLMNRFHYALHDIVMERFKAAGIDTILGQRIKDIPDWSQNDGKEFSITLADGREVKTDLAIPCTGSTVPLSDPLLSLSPSSVDPVTKYVKVKPTLQIADSKFPNVFSIGDVADTGAHKAARPAFAQAQIVLRNIQKLMKDEKAELDTYKPDPHSIHLALGFRPSVKFRNPASPDGEPMKIFDDHGDLESGCGKVWAMRAPGVSDYKL
ncbi:FAD/NAD(P)-binding domain-containing protein [Guyanagaster necrorhizus]|uniref:FAD/NAD(P)-binding domain-containing protein n=1 Tax=Guyanagaster necrorhizus TaxID=856835 RepID=A0A9P7VIX8_9AGAR|nr:FAD/NAD(P)-binding domain-containing protein [Guyanagaster necrorhizus MCA 3950]KAG7441943.1 FAD/NAD(P)-binding domain-containing protein [Guyanagaster necrorhizus MCA 3950]